MKALLKRLIGADRRRIIAVIGVTQKDVLEGVAHARTSGSELPVWVWCAQALDEPLDRSLERCERVVTGVGAVRVRKDLGSVWPALTIVAWTGQRGAAVLKLLCVHGAAVPHRDIERSGWILRRQAGAACRTCDTPASGWLCVSGQKNH